MPKPIREEKKMENDKPKFKLPEWKGGILATDTQMKRMKAVVSLCQDTPQGKKEMEEARKDAEAERKP
jgi:hypothetical protein